MFQRSHSVMISQSGQVYPYLSSYFLPISSRALYFSEPFPGLGLPNGSTSATRRPEIRVSVVSLPQKKTLQSIIFYEKPRSWVIFWFYNGWFYFLYASIPRSAVCKHILAAKRPAWSIRRQAVTFEAALGLELIDGVLGPEDLWAGAESSMRQVRRVSCQRFSDLPSTKTPITKILISVTHVTGSVPRWAWVCIVH